MRVTPVSGAVLSAVLLLVQGCGHAPGKEQRGFDEACGCFVGEVPAAGTLTLTARSAGPDSDGAYWSAAASFEHGGISGSDKLTGNDWDLLFGNDPDPSGDLFDVNTVTDDRSFIVDLGERPLRDAPETVNPDAFPAQRGTIAVDAAVQAHSGAKVAEGHVYWVRTNDSNSSLVTLVGVQKHVKNQSVTIAWFRSKEADRFVFDWPAAK
ncbi:MAG: hypothetical protein JNJ54_22645 [Myxococcaceae bacterium]|nr:hypothetical protein [Myxococcaceae bacterium]